MNLRTLTIKQVVAQTGLPRSTVYKLVKAGELAHLKGRAKASTIRILETSLEAWFDRNAKGAPDAPRPVPVARDADADLPSVEEPVLS